MPACRCTRHRFDPWVWKLPRRRAQQPIPVFLPRESHGQRSLAGCRPQGHTELRRLSMRACGVTEIRSAGKLKLGLSFLLRSGEWRIIYHKTEGSVTLRSGVQSLEHHMMWFCPEGLWDTAPKGCIYLSERFISCTDVAYIFWALKLELESHFLFIFWWSLFVIKPHLTFWTGSISNYLKARTSLSYHLSSFCHRPWYRRGSG